MSDYISREWLSNAIHNFFNGLNHNVTEEDIQAYINATPGADVRENIHGEWILNPDDNSVTCNKCGKGLYLIDLDGEGHFCPNCGADMRGKAE